MMRSSGLFQLALLALATAGNLVFATDWDGPAVACSPGRLETTNPRAVSIKTIDHAEHMLPGPDFLLAKMFFSNWTTVVYPGVCAIGDPTRLADGTLIIPDGHTTLPDDFKALLPQGYAVGGQPPTAVSWNYCLGDEEGSYCQLAGWVDSLANTRLCAYSLHLKSDKAAFGMVDPAVDC